MTEVFNIKNLPQRRIRQKVIVALAASESLGQKMTEAKRQMALDLARKIMDEPEFFKLGAQDRYVTYSSNVIVLTEDELAQLMRDQFAAGVRHAEGFMPEYPHD